jgi:hypothetical protein
MRLMSDKTRDLKEDKTIDALKILIREISKKHEVSIEEILVSLKEEKQTDEIPISLFYNDAGYLELISVYSKDILKYNFAKIASILNRDQRTIWTSYNKCRKKISQLKIEKTKTTIPLNVFSNRKFSTFENMVLFLSKNRSIMEISTILKKDYKTIWTALSRAGKKQDGS